MSSNASQSTWRAVTRRRKTLAAFRDQVSLFKYLSPLECQVMHSLTEARHYEHGAVVVSEGKPSSGLHIVESGEVSVSKINPHGHPVLFASIKPYGHFGEMSILNDQPADCSVHSVGGVNLLVLPRSEFTNLMHRSESLGLRVLRALCEELSNRLREQNKAAV